MAQFIKKKYQTSNLVGKQVFLFNISVIYKGINGIAVLKLSEESITM